MKSVIRASMAVGLLAAASSVAFADTCQTWHGADGTTHACVNEGSYDHTTTAYVFVNPGEEDELSSGQPGIIWITTIDGSDAPNFAFEGAVAGEVPSGRQPDRPL